MKSFGQKIWNWTQKHASLLTFLFLLGIIAATSWSLFTAPGQIGETHDFLHGARIVEMARGLQDGHFPVVWSQNYGFGFGMPLFEFYAPLPYYVGALFYLLGLNTITAAKLLFFICNILTVWGSYLLGKKVFKSRLAGVLAAASIALAPYRAVDLFVRGAISESWAIMALPWILYATTLIFDRRSAVSPSRVASFRRSLLLTLSLFVLFLSHNLTVMLATPFLIAFALIYWLAIVDWSAIKKGWLFWRDQLWLWLKLAFSYLLAFGLTAFYLLPAFLEKDLTQVSGYVINTYFDFRIHFLYLKQFFQVNWQYGGSTYGPGDAMSFFLGFGQIILAVFTLGLLLVQLIKFFQQKSNTSFTQNKNPKLFLRTWEQNTPKHPKVFLRKLRFTFTKNRFIFIFLGGISLLILLAAFMSLHYSHGIWEAIPLLAFTQFPWRFLAIIVPLLGLLGAGAYYLFPKSPLFIAAYLVLIAGNFYFFQTNPDLTQNGNRYYNPDPGYIRSESSYILVDYLPKDFDLFTVNFYHAEESPVPFPAAMLFNAEAFENGAPTELVDRVHQKEFQTNYSIPATLTLNLAFYPGWTYYLDDQLVADQLAVSSHGLIQINIPAGQHQVRLTLEPTPLRQTAELISLISFFILIILIICLASQPIINRKAKTHAS